MPSSSATMSDTVRYTSRSPGPAAAGNASAGVSCAGGSPPFTTSSSAITGTASAVSFSQNWNACTNVIERMPPAATTTATMTATASDPAQAGRPVVIRTVSAAPCSCGTM